MYKTKFSLPTNKMFGLLLIVLRKASVNSSHYIIILPKVVGLGWKGNWFKLDIQSCLSCYDFNYMYMYVNATSNTVYTFV